IVKGNRGQGGHGYLGLASQLAQSSSRGQADIRQIVLETVDEGWHVGLGLWADAGERLNRAGADILIAVGEHNGAKGIAKWRNGGEDLGSEISERGRRPRPDIAVGVSQHPAQSRQHGGDGRTDLEQFLRRASPLLLFRMLQERQPGAYRLTLVQQGVLRAGAHRY